mmetsp:Transcript_17439/g.39891  ORF Transcript_17439/g.39891 Transcript_17439/m.39891 type:complete len:225 (+) Transcript_17439:867-1541(+)
MAIKPPPNLSTSLPETSKHTCAPCRTRSSRPPRPDCAPHTRSSSTRCWSASTALPSPTSYIRSVGRVPLRLRAPCHKACRVAMARCKAHRATAAARKGRHEGRRPATPTAPRMARHACTSRTCSRWRTCAVRAAYGEECTSRRRCRRERSSPKASARPRCSTSQSCELVTRGKAPSHRTVRPTGAAPLASERASSMVALLFGSTSVRHELSDAGPATGGRIALQ